MTLGERKFSNFWADSLSLQKWVSRHPYQFSGFFFLTKRKLGPCKYVTCAWNSWTRWSATCGRMTRQRSSKVTQHVVNRPNCNGLQTSCPAPQTESTFVSCMLHYLLIHDDFLRECFTWSHVRHIGAPHQLNGGQVGVPNPSCVDWTFFSCETFLLSQKNLSSCCSRGWKRSVAAYYE